MPGHVAVGPDPPVQALHKVKPLFSDLHLCHTMPSSQHELKKTKVRLEGLHQTPTARCHMRSRLRRLQYKHAQRCIPVNRFASTNTHQKISLNTRCVIYAIYSRTRGDCIHIGITYHSAWQRFKEHLKAARKYLNVPPQARDHGKATHALYRVWGKYGIKDSALMPLLVLGRPSNFADKDDFHARMDHHEAYFIDVAKTLSPRGYNVRTTNQAKRECNRATARRKRGNRAVQNQSSPDPSSSSDSDPDDAPPPPPLSPQGQLLAGQAAAPALGAAQRGQPSPVSALPCSSYARRASVHLKELRLLQNAFTWNAATNNPSTSLVGENPVLAYLKVCHMRALTKMSGVLSGFSVTDLDRCRPAGATCSWTFDDVQFYVLALPFVLLIMHSVHHMTGPKLHGGC